VVSTPLKNMKISWGYYSRYMESHKSHVPNPQIAMNNYRNGNSDHSIGIVPYYCGFLGTGTHIPSGYLT
jgi:hypothetical protein